MHPHSQHNQLIEIAATAASCSSRAILNDLPGTCAVQCKVAVAEHLARGHYTVRVAVLSLRFCNSDVRVILLWLIVTLMYLTKALQISRQIPPLPCVMHVLHTSFASGNPHQRHAPHQATNHPRNPRDTFG